MTIALNPAYSRSQAVEDGVLVDVTDDALRVGYQHAVALTALAHERAVAWTDEDEARKGGRFTGQDVETRLNDALWTALCAMRRVGRRERAVQFSMYLVPRNSKGCIPMPVRLVARIGPGDRGEAVVTILTPEEC